MNNIKIDKIKKSGSKYKITLSNGDVITTYDDVILENGLLFSKNISKDLFDKIINDTLYYQSYHKVIDMISRKLRSEHEIMEYLDKNGINYNDAYKIVLSLKRIGLINDLFFAKAFFNDKVNLSLDGPEKIKSGLRKSGISENIISEVCVFDKNIIYDRINRIINKKKKSVKGSEFSFKQKLLIYLFNLGYDREDSLECLSNMNFDSDFSEMDKIYDKLLKKYSGDKLIYMLRGKLYSKGYKMEDINDFLNKKQLS